jgi:hypothetical protein
VDATALVTIEESAIEVRFQKRAHNPLLLAAGFDRFDQPVSWLGKQTTSLGLRVGLRGVNSIP